jgi:FkbM family methyltransferase
MKLSTMSETDHLEPLRLISYAQNREDILLHRALGHVKRGRYVDIGAAWPSQDSVTRLFYDRGWSGVNVEPNPQLLSELRRERARDVNLGVAIGEAAGVRTFALIPDTGLSTLDAELAEQHRSDGREVVWIDVTVKTLASILDEYVPDGVIHFLKIDVEGAEAEVIAGNDWSRFRPWIVVAEVGNPSNPAYSDPLWERDLLAHSYTTAFDDGVNRFYVAHEHAELANALAVPPNALDGFVAASVVDLENALNALHTAESNVRDIEWRLVKERERGEWLIHEAETKAAMARADVRALRLALAETRAAATSDAHALADATQRSRELESKNEELHAQIADLLGSRSWQVSRPLRIAYSLKAAPGPGLRYITYRLLGGRFGSARLIRPGGTSGSLRALARRAMRISGADVTSGPDVDAAAARLEAEADWLLSSRYETDCAAVLQSIVPLSRST